MKLFAPEFESLLAVVAADLDEDGILLAANAGFRRLIGVDGVLANGTPVARFFIHPDFAGIVGASAEAEAEGELYRGQLTIGLRLGPTQSLHGRIWRTAGGLHVLAEYDIKDLERLYSTALELNGDYANAHWALAQSNLKLRHLNTVLAQHEAELVLYRDHLEAMIDERTAALEEASRIGRDIQRAMDGAGISVFWVDLESGHILYVNNSAAEVLGYSVAQMLQLNIADIDPSADAAMLGQLQARLTEQGRLQIESSHQTKDGRNFPVEITLFYGAATPEMAAHSIAFAKDISLRKAAEIALAAANAAAEASRGANEERMLTEAAARMQSRKLEAMGTLAAGIAHDFNNILGSIVGFAEMTGDTLPEGSSTKYNVEQILGASFRARDLIARLLAFARESPLIPVPVDAVAEVQETLALLSSTLKPSVRLSLHNGMDAAQAPLIIMADPTQIQQIVMNLVINAAHAITLHGTIRVDIDDLSQIQDKPSHLGEGLCLVVSDDGSGMTPEVLERMYDPFFTTKAPNEGSGLGLSVVYGIVTDLGGVIKVRSTSDGDTTGTEFRVFLPLTNDKLQTGETHGAHLVD